jgi:hypothetical protein
LPLAASTFVVQRVRPFEVVSTTPKLQVNDPMQVDPVHAVPEVDPELDELSPPSSEAPQPVNKTSEQAIRLKEKNRCLKNGFIRTPLRSASSWRAVPLE